MQSEIDVKETDLNCIIDPCNQIGTQLRCIATDVDSEEFEYYPACSKHYDELMRQYHGQENINCNNNNINQQIKVQVSVA
jgi:hypothetical protein